MEKKRVLVVGGTGYLGQHLLEGLSRAEELGLQRPYDLAYTHHRPAPPREMTDALAPVLAFRVDLETGQGFDSISETFGQPHVVINCAALSVPLQCEKNPTYATAINVPSSLVGWLSSFANNDSLLIHLSTDQVYEGVKSFYKEDDEAVPVNMYGKSKVSSEKFISSNYSNFAILRSSIIYGPQTMSPVSKSLPIQYAVSWQEVDFFYDEFRCPIYVKDLVNIILILIKKRVSDENPMRLLLNVGGPERVSRLQMAEKVADVRGHDSSLIKAVSASSVPDISMDISRLTQELGVTPVCFKNGVQLTFGEAHVEA
ncbi:unnamed protein product [Spirodela intermedia]|uniref:RmlD-like substrate binding domain-containing protein n=1 Tax=Spirodela intermedia TaxID=51605 RepID=A0A7I8IDA2_SPIIN|nr:unnamed protein product [Spirodela intermedia]CAA6655639.1 unnamed protein product [Spirodela intermedia]